MVWWSIDNCNDDDDPVEVLMMLVELVEEVDVAASSVSLSKAAQRVNVGRDEVIDCRDIRLLRLILLLLQEAGTKAWTVVLVIARTRMLPTLCRCHESSSSRSSSNRVLASRSNIVPLHL